MQYTLHNYRRCPFCIRLRILMYLKGIEYDVIEEPLRKWTQWMVDWSHASGEEARIPVLRCVDDAGQEEVLIESNNINMVLDARHGDPTYTPAVGSAAYEDMLAWFSWCDDVLKPQIDLFKYGENLQLNPETHGMHTEQLYTLVQKLEDTLSAKQYLIGDTLTLADIAVIPFVRQIMRTREGEFDFADFPKTATWTNNIIETEWFQDIVMKKYPLAPVHGTT